MSRLSISSFFRHFLKNSKCFIFVQTQIKLDIWLQSYEEFDNAKKQCNYKLNGFW